MKSFAGATERLTLPRMSRATDMLTVHTYDTFAQMGFLRPSARGEGGRHESEDHAFIKTLTTMMRAERWNSGFTKLPAFLIFFCLFFDAATHFFSILYATMRCVCVRVCYSQDTHTRNRWRDF